MNGKQYFVMSHEKARENALNAVRNAPEGFSVVVEPPKRSGEQNKLIHSALTDLGRRMGWKFGGVDVDLDSLKIIFMVAFRRINNIAGSRFVIGLDGHPVDLGVKTSKLTKKECSEFIEMINAYANGGDV